MIHQIALADLVINAALNTVPMLGAVAKRLLGGKSTTEKQVGKDLDAERAALWASLDREGILEPIKAHKDEKGRWIIDDGRHRFEWALATGQAKVPVVEVTPQQGHALIEATVIGRRHWTKGQRAYLGVLLHPEVAGVQPGRPKITDSVGNFTATDLAERLGVSVDTVHQAVELYRTFHAPGAPKSSPEAIEAADFKDRYEMSIWAGAGLGAVLAGIAGGQSTGGKARPDSGFHSLDKPLATLGRLSGLYTKWDEAERSKALRLMTTRLRESTSPEFRLALSEALAAATE
jgi:hypothetical protein